MAIKHCKRYIATPVFPNIVFVWLGSNDSLCHRCYIFICAEDDYFFGILHSRPHEIWSLVNGVHSFVKQSGFRYTPTTTFETFPFPWPPGQEPQDDPRVQAIAAAACELVEIA
jgi:hypothetical protein